MANFSEAFAHTMREEGGYVFDPDDTGGETYMGIARVHHGKWSGWQTIDILKQKANFPRSLDTNATLQQQVQELYEVNYWDRIRGDDIADQDIAESIFDFAVNAGVRTSSKLTQVTVGVVADGVIGAASLAKINADDKRGFLAVFALAKIGRYVGICERRQTSRKYFFGWVRRTLEGV